jgi:hypothetical protein
MKTKPIKIILLSLLLIAIGFGIFVWVDSRPAQIFREFAGVELILTECGDYEILQVVNIVIDGRLYNDSFRGEPNRFAGLFEVDAYYFTRGSHARIDFVDGMGNILHTHAFRGWPEHERLGIMYNSADLENIIIERRERLEHDNISTWVRMKNRFIIAPLSAGESPLPILLALGLEYEE